MFRNYIRLAWRKIKADRLFSTLNILGLSIGLGITLLLFLFVFHEKSFDTMYPKKDRIVRVLLHTTNQQISEILPVAFTRCYSPMAKVGLPTVVPNSVPRFRTHYADSFSSVSSRRQPGLRHPTGPVGSS